MSKKPWTEIRKKLHEKPDILVGKNGITDSLVDEVKNQLKKKRILKVKFLRNIAQSKSDALKLAEELAMRTNAKIGKVIGKTAILYKE